MKSYRWRQEFAGAIYIFGVACRKSIRDFITCGHKQKPKDSNCLHEHCLTVITYFNMILPMNEMISIYSYLNFCLLQAYRLLLSPIENVIR